MSSIFTHTTLGSNDRAKSAAFYKPTLATLGINHLGELGDAATLYGADSPQFIVFSPSNGEPAHCGNGVTVSFAAPSRDAVHKFHEAGLANGGTDEGAPGPRPFTPTAYAAYLRDPDGNKICTYCFADE